MPLETAQFINQLNEANPLGSDPIAAGDDHLRLIKSTLKNTFPNVSGAVTLTQAQLNALPSDVTGVQSSVTALTSSTNAALGTKADKAVTITAGSGLTGGGDLSANRTLAIANNSNGFGVRTISTAAPTGGSNGDIWYQI